MKYLTVLILACCLLISGCVPSTGVYESPSAGTPDPSAELTTPAATPSVTPEILSEPGFMLPELCDPLGFFADPEVYTLSADEVAAKYGAVYETIPDLYEIPNITIGGYDARLFIQTKDGKVEQVCTTLNASLGWFYETPEGSPDNKDVYNTLVDTLGEPDRYYDYDEEKEIGAEDFLDIMNHTAAQWKRDGRTYEFGYIGQGADGERPHYIAVYREKLSMREFHFYEFPGGCCPHEDMGSYFDPTGIFMDGTLFTDDAQTVFCRYGARPAYAGEANRKLVGDPDRPYIYIVEGLSVGGYPASLGFSWNSEYPWNAYYEIDLLGQSSEAVYELVNEVLSEIEGTPGIELSYAGVDAAALPLSYFDENSPQDSHGGKSFTYSYALNRANVTYRISVLYYRNAAYMRGSDTDGYIVPALHGITIHVSRWVLK